jgi:VanZ family protein
MLESNSVRQAARIAGWLLLAVIAFLSLSPASLRPVTPVGHTMEHVLAHVLVGGLFGIGYSKRPWLLVLSLVGLTAAIELAQLFVPGRHARLGDFVVDAGAACLGVGLAWIGKVGVSIFSRASQSGY